jgi:hypothetical protein
MTSVAFELVQNFILGGVIVASISYLGTFMNPVAAAIFWSYPISILPSVYFMKKNGKTNQYVSKFLYSTTLALVLLLLCTFAMGHYIGAAPSSTSIWGPVGKATLWWLGGSVVYYLAVEYGGYRQYFM